MTLNQKYRHIRRRMHLFVNRIRSSYRVKRDGKFFRIVIPNQYRNKIRFLKYLFTAIGLFSVFIVFSSVLISFLSGIVIYLLTLILEKTVFMHPVMLIHALPDFEIDTEKWVGVGFGYTVLLDEGFEIPLVSMVVTDLDYAKKIADFFLQCTGGSFRDEEKNIKIDVVVTDSDEYIFLCYPNPRRPLARKFFKKEKRNLQKISLEDEVAEMHLTFVFGKRCKIEPASYFPEFRNRYRNGVPIMFEFIVPPFDLKKPTKEIPPFIFFDFSIKERSRLTRKDFAYDAIYSFEHGGSWQGPNGNRQ